MTTAQQFVDCFSPIAPDFADVLVVDSYDGACRYLGFYTHPEWGKGMDKSEASMLVSKRLRIVSVWEGNSIRAIYFSAAQGTTDGEQSLYEARMVGQQKGSAIYHSVDCDMAVQDLPRLIPHFEAIHKVVGDEYEIGVYGKAEVCTYVVEHCPFVKHQWQTAAWSGGKLAPNVALYQDKFNVSIKGHSVDVDEVKGDIGAWPVVKPATKPTPAQPTKGSENVKTQQVTELYATVEDVATIHAQDAHGKDLFVLHLHQAAIQTPVTPMPVSQPVTHPSTGKTLLQEVQGTKVVLDGELLAQINGHPNGLAKQIVQIAVDFVKADGSTMPLDMMLDTGSVENLIGQTAANMIGLVVDGTSGAMGVGSGALQFNRSTCKFILNGETFTSPCMITNTSGPQLLFGGQFFEDNGLTLEIDYKTYIVRIWK